ncbi:universal stress protein UspA [Camelimonas fluminis]|uniref:Universal stress protein n=1 Tax=Camelimonas fluminis TaxID=1576911 RepID=A0ABV7UD09_9HYPH|nr:universal stress protein [Camelimonas fluminis]GHE46157.1 universal stress protein UspA [Camelimonas fluminis]
MMDLMVHLDGSAEDEVRLAHARTVIASIGAPSVTRLIGLFTNALPEFATVMPIEAGAAAVSVVADIEDQVRREGDNIEKALNERLAGYGVPYEVRRLEARPAGLARLAARQARWADLFIATCPYRGDAEQDWGDLVEAVLTESGRGVLLAPPGAHAPEKFDRVLIGWRDCRQATRAVAEAMPLIASARQTDIVYAFTKEDEATDRSAEDLAAHLRRQVSQSAGQVAIHPVKLDAGVATEALLDESERLGSNLMVMGGYGQSRWLEWFMGGTTRDVITQTDRALLLAH